MLVLNLRENEAVLIGDDIKIMVMEIRGKQVHLGIAAPPGLLILRGEERPSERHPKELKLRRHHR